MKLSNSYKILIFVLIGISTLLSIASLVFGHAASGGGYLNSIIIPLKQINLFFILIHLIVFKGFKYFYLEDWVQQY